ALHRVRSRLVGQRAGVINQIRGFLVERGIIVRQGVVPLRRALADILSANRPALSPRVVNLIAELARDGRRLDERIAAVSAEIESLVEQDEACQRVMTVSGVVPKQESTGDRTILGKISKRGNKYLRTLFVQAAHVVLTRRPSAAMRGRSPRLKAASSNLQP